MVNLYPFETLPDLGFPDLLPGSDLHYDINARNLSQEELTLLQSAYIWMQTHNSGAITLPQSMQASYSELYYMLQCFEHTQNLVRSVRQWYSAQEDAHRLLYNQQQVVVVLALPVSTDYDVLLHYDFAMLKAVIRNCAGFHYDLQHCRNLEGGGESS